MAYSTLHQSYFTYNLSKPYPFRWFTPVTIAIFIIGTVLFSLLNFAANGYVLVNQVSIDPNATILEEGTWFKEWPSFFIGSNRPKCEPFMLQKSDTFFTNQTALTYAITSLTQINTGDILSSLEYNNYVLEDCKINSVDVDIQGVTVRSPRQFAFTQWGAVSRADIICTVTGAQGPVMINMTTTYDYVLDRTSLNSVGSVLGTGFIQRNKTGSPNLWWGESLMSLHWVAVAATMENIQNSYNQAGDIILKGIVSFTEPRQTQAIADLDFFTVDSRFTIEKEDRTIVVDPEMDQTIDSLHGDSNSPDVWIQVDNLVKSMYSTILTDLGQTTVSPNILTDQDLIRNFLSEAEKVLEENVAKNARPGPATEQDYINGTSVDIIASTNPFAQLTPSVIRVSYLCQVPRRKSAGNLLVSIIIADLVFLQAVWVMFKFIVDVYILKDDDDDHFRGVSTQQYSSARERSRTLYKFEGTKFFDSASTHRRGESKTRLLSPYISRPYRSASASASISASSLPMSTSDLLETDEGYALNTLDHADTGSTASRKGDDHSDIGLVGAGSRTGWSHARRPFHRRTSSAYDVVSRSRDRYTNGGGGRELPDFI